MERACGRLNREAVWRNPLQVPARPSFGPGEFPSGVALSYRFAVEPRNMV